MTNEKKQLETDLKKYFKDLAEKSRLEYQLDRLQGLYDKLMDLRKYKKSEELEEKLDEIGKKILQIQMHLIEICENSIELEYVITKLTDEERKILELKYKFNKNLNSIAQDIFVSKSTVSRKLNTILENILMLNIET